MQKIESLDEIKQIEFNIMKTIHSFCESNNIKYYLGYGTLLGAIRHDGFIPWDDDIDIQMFRDDYEKFIKEFSKVQEQFGLKIVNANTKPYFGRNMTKVIDTKTILIERKYKTDDQIGVFVDIWPLDGTPNNYLIRKMVVLKAKLLCKMQLAASSDYKQEKQIGRRVAVVLCNFLSPNKLIEKIDKIAKRYSTRDSNYLFMYCGKEKEIEKSLFENQISHKFEDTMFKIPSGYDEILKTYYGDYMTLPKNQVPNHDMEVFYK